MKLIRWMKKSIIAGMISILFITAISYFYSFSGVHISTGSGATDYAWDSKQRKATMSEGIAFIDMDQNGYNNSPPKGPTTSSAGGMGMPLWGKTFAFPPKGGLANHSFLLVGRLKAALF